MKKLLLTILAVLATVTSYGTSTIAYGILAFDEEDYRKINSIVSFPLEGGNTTYDVVAQFGKTNLYAGAYAEGFYYAESTKLNSIGAEVPDALLKVDLETGKYTTVGTLEGFGSFINDMSYDYSTKQFWAVAKNAAGTISELLTIDKNTAKVEKKFDLDRKFFTLACTYEGQLYAISFQGDFCKIDKNTGVVTVVGKLPCNPNYIQSMEFDHTDGTLYWAASITTVQPTPDGFTTEMDETFMAFIDPETATVSRLGNIGSSGQIVGLYIPFAASAANTPAAVANLSVTPGENGAPEATLKWTNPSKTFGRQPLTELTEVKIYRNDVVVKSLTGTKPGEAVTYTDKIDNFVGGKVEYRVVPCNANGEGVPTETKLFVGADVPSAPLNPTVNSDNHMEAVITWTAPQGSLNGGWYNPAEVTYKVVRNDGVVVADGISALTATNKITGAAKAYTYTITAVNKAGNGASATTSAAILGSNNTLPYMGDFNDDETAATWTIINADGDENTWVRMRNVDAGKVAMAYKPTAESAGEDYLMSYFFDFEAGKKYEVTTSAFIYGLCDFEFLLYNKEKGYTSIKTFTDATTNWRPGELSFTFTPAESGKYQFGIKSLSEAGSNYLWIYSIAIKERQGENLAAKDIDGDSKPSIGSSSVYLVTIKNTGASTISDYTVKLIDTENGNTLATAAAVPAIESGKEVIVTVAWTPESTAVNSVTGVVEFADDSNEADNKTQAFAVDVQPKGSGSVIKIGTSSTTDTDYAPFDPYDGNSAALNYYLHYEIGKDKTYIESIEYTGTSFENKAVPVKVYMANTAKADVELGWIPENMMTLVYDGDVTIDGGFGSAGAKEFTLNIPLSTPFEYTGKNLAVLTVLNMGSSSTLNAVRFKNYTRPKYCGCRIWYGAGEAFDFEKFKFIKPFNSSITLYTKDKMGSVDQINGEDAGSKPQITVSGGMLNAAGNVSAIQITDIAGRVAAVANGNRISVASLKGAYVVTVTYSDGTRKSAMIALN